MINKLVSSGNIKQVFFLEHISISKLQSCPKVLYKETVWHTRIKTQQFKWPAWIDLIIENIIK